MCSREFRAQLGGLLRFLPGPHIVVWCKAVEQGHRAQHVIIGTSRSGAARRGMYVVLTSQFADKRVHDNGCDFVLNFKNIVQVAVEAFRPDLVPGRRLNQLRRHSNLIARLSDATVKDVSDAQLARDIRYLQIATPVDEGRLTRDDKQLIVAGQLRNYVVGDTIGEIRLLGIAGHVLEG